VDQHEGSTALWRRHWSILQTRSESAQMIRSELSLVSRTQDDVARGRAAPACASREKEHWFALPLHYLFGAIPVGGNR
jgi:hypothetical protein